MNGQTNYAAEIRRLNEARSQIIGNRITELADAHGSLRALAQAIDVDHVYLWRLKKGEKTNPSEAILKRLGLA